MTDKKTCVGLFDFDGTLARGDSALPFALFTLRKHPRALIEMPWLASLVTPYGMGLVSKKRIKNALLKLLRQVPPGDRDRLVEDFHREVLQPRYLQSGLERVQWHRQQGHLLILATASVDTYMERVRQQLGFDVLVATRTTLEPVPTIVGANCWGEEKVRRLQQLSNFADIDWDRSWAYSDHLSDRPIMQLCGHRLATTPTRALHRYARQQGWPIVDWS